MSRNRIPVTLRASRNEKNRCAVWACRMGGTNVEDRYMLWFFQSKFGRSWVEIKTLKSSRPFFGIWKPLKWPLSPLAPLPEHQYRGDTVTWKTEESCEDRWLSVGRLDADLGPRKIFVRTFEVVRRKNFVRIQHLVRLWLKICPNFGSDLNFSKKSVKKSLNIGKTCGS